MSADDDADDAAATPNATKATMADSNDDTMAASDEAAAAYDEKATQLLIDCLYYHDMYFSPRRLKDAAAVDELLGKLTSKTAKLHEMKEQIRIRVLGLGWDDLHHPWSKDRKEFSFEELAAHLKNKIIPEESKREIPSKPPVKSLDRKELPVHTWNTISRCNKVEYHLGGEREGVERDCRKDTR